MTLDQRLEESVKECLRRSGANIPETNLTKEYREIIKKRSIDDMKVIDEFLKLITQKSPT